MSKFLIIFSILTFSTSLFAQDVPAGLWTDSFLSDTNGKAIVVPGNSSLGEITAKFSTATITSLYESKKFTVVMDASPLGDLSSLADDERLVAAGKQDVALACIVSAFSAPKAARIVIRCSKKDGGKIEFVGSEGEPNSFFMNKKIDFPSDVVEFETLKPKVETIGGNIIALNTLTNAQSITFELKKRTREGARQMLAFSPIRTNKRRVVAGVGEPIKHDVFYELIEKPDYAKSYRAKHSLKTALFITGGTLLALGGGLTFVGLVANDGCENFGCRTLAIPVAGIASLILGATGISWGFLIQKYPTTKEEDQQLIDVYNDKL